MKKKQKSFGRGAKRKKQKQKQVPTGKREEFARAFQDIRNFHEVQARREEIEDALAVLAQHVDAYDRLRKTPAKWLLQNNKLFDEKPFEEMRFHAADLQRAFEVVGYPGLDILDEKNMDNMAKAVHFLLSDVQREALAYRLLLLVPAYVKAGRYMEGIMLRQNVDILMEPSSDVLGGFLGAMFMYGLDEWEAQRVQEEEELFKDLGISLEELHRIGIEGLETWIRSIETDPKKCAALEKCLTRYPELAGMAKNRCRDSEAEALELLKREESDVLLLTLQDVTPWLVVLEKRLTDAPEDFLSLAKARVELSQALLEALEKLLYELSFEMARAIFTPKRLKIVTTQLEKLRSRFEADGDQLGIDQIEGALMAMHLKTVAGSSYFLTSLCYASLRRQMG